MGAVCLCVLGGHGNHVLLGYDAASGVYPRSQHMGWVAHSPDSTVLPGLCALVCLAARCCQSCRAVKPSQRASHKQCMRQQLVWTSVWHACSNDWG